MTMTKIIRFAKIVLLGLMLGAFPLQVHAEDVPLVDGSLWQESTNAEKISYLVGANNFLSIEYAFQQRNGNPPSDEQSTVRMFWEHSEGVTLDDAIEGIDNWYAINPKSMDRSVLDVIWVIWVLPNLN